MAAHGTADDPTAYCDFDRIEEEKQTEGVGRYEQYLRRRGLLTDELAQQVREEALVALREGIAAAEAMPPADSSEVFDHAYVDPPPGVRHG